MKKVILLIFSFLSISQLSFSQSETPKTAEVQIKTSAICKQCKKRIEHDLAFEKGVVSSNLDLNTKVITVVYKTKKTAPEKIRTAISKIGYAADDVKPDEKGFNKLPECCQKEQEGEVDKH